MKNECTIIRDILPLYIDKMVSEDTIAFVEEHLEKCAACRTELEKMKTPNALEIVASNTQANDEKPLKAFKKRYNRKLFFIVVTTVIITIFAPMLLVRLSSQIAYCLLPVISLVFGIVLLNKSATEINSVFGFRTKTSSKSPQTWGYCNKLCAKVLIAVGSMSMIVIAVFNNISNLLFGIFEVGEMVNIIVIVAILISIPIVDNRCKKKFPDLFYDNKP